MNAELIKRLQIAEWGAYATLRKEAADALKQADADLLAQRRAHAASIDSRDAEIKELRRVVSESQQKLRTCRVEKQKVMNDLIEEMAQ